MSQLKKKKVLRHRRKKQPWPMIILSTGGILFVIVAIMAFKKPSQPKAAIEVTGAPGLKVDHEKIDLGDVKLGQTVEVKFKLTNVGDKTLRFSKVPYVEVLKGC